MKTLPCGISTKVEFENNFVMIWRSLLREASVPDITHLMEFPHTLTLEFLPIFRATIPTAGSSPAVCLNMVAAEAIDILLRL